MATETDTTSVKSNGRKKRYSAICPTCGETRYLTNKRDAANAKQCRRCHCQGIAHKGWEATKARYGEKVTVKHLRHYRLANPSNLERAVIQVLETLGIGFQREVWFETSAGQVYLIDFVIGDTAIEVQGDWAHQFHQERDKRKLAALEAAGYTIITLSESQVKNGLEQALACLSLIHSPPLSDRVFALSDIFWYTCLYERSRIWTISAPFTSPG